MGIVIDGFVLGCPICGYGATFNLYGSIKADENQSPVLLGGIEFGCGGEFEGFEDGSLLVKKSCNAHRAPVGVRIGGKHVSIGTHSDNLGGSQSPAGTRST